MELGYTADYLFLGLFVILLAYLIVPPTPIGFGATCRIIRGLIVPTLSDLQKLVDNMKRAQTVVNRAAGDAAKHTAIMDAFEKRLDLNHESMNKIDEYEKLMAAMDMGDNGGPALTATFSSSAQSPTSVTAPSTKGLGRFDS